MSPFVLSLAVLAIGELSLLPGIRRRLRSSDQDRGTTVVLAALIVLASASALAFLAFLHDHPAWQVPEWVAWAGLGLTIAATAMRVWAMRSLGDRFTLTVQVAADQPLVQHGPYRILRHPAYLGSDMALAGVGLASGCWPAAVVLVPPVVLGHVLRIRAEEAALEETLGAEWRAWRARTWRLIPFVW